ncbi:MAG: hypothetical protein WDO69_29880 [Pseudomonadota bacterium]
MSAVNPLSDSALQPHDPEASDDAPESSQPTQPWNAPPSLLDALGAFEFEEEDFDFHDTIPAPPWLDEPPDALEALTLLTR